MTVMYSKESSVGGTLWVQSCAKKKSYEESQKKSYE